MWNLTEQSIGMVGLKMVKKYLKEPISTKLRLEIIQKHARWGDSEVINLRPLHPKKRRRAASVSPQNLTIIRFLKVYYVITPITSIF